MCLHCNSAIPLGFIQFEPLHRLQYSVNRPNPFPLQIQVVQLRTHHTMFWSRTSLSDCCRQIFDVSSKICSQTTAPDYHLAIFRGDHLQAAKYQIHKLEKHRSNNTAGCFMTRSVHTFSSCFGNSQTHERQPSHSRGNKSLNIHFPACRQTHTFQLQTTSTPTISAVVFTKTLLKYYDLP